MNSWRQRFAGDGGSSALSQQKMLSFSYHPGNGQPIMEGFAMSLKAAVTTEKGKPDSTADAWAYSAASDVISFRSAAIG